MQITIKTLQNSVFKIESELDVDVANLKKKIEEQNKDQYPVDRQKLIYQGKILEDEKQLSDYNLTEKGFIVLMIVKPKPKPAEAPKPAEEPKAETSTETASTATTETTPAPATTPAATPAAESTPAATPAPATPAATTPTATSATPAAPPANPFSDELINNITVMGFPRDQVVAALRAAFGNPDRAVEYLMNGIPEHLTREQAPAPAAQSGGAQAAAAATPTSNPTPTSNMSTFDRIRQEPQFQQIRQIIRTNPHLLEQFIQQMSRENPELFRDITAHQEEFIQMLNEDAGDDAPAAQEQLGGAGGPTITREQDGRVTLQVTEAERQAIDRLKQLGFPEDMVVQAYFACDKNEELAANFLLSNAFD